ncbi:amino acid adenylation domain-containing protein [Actinosynnema pretiosum subsp. pretiosum]|uniref:Amino acid adenylation domain-containing protein n=1 Tax=Actinosynnema pretiosum subsp. pretiosum TaxID=103721 RepID=A0AA45L6Q9_9PSEU|nr:Malonyl CoA-acyl carrier protein transacylase [Actinosynnema pretiosum subsp. pretiosum]QUF04088.1 amino acid adenylation domain-containing protein [Actinosynnema pretiosum subsp. pretiosum]
MTNTTNTATADHVAWWVDRFAVRHPEAGPPLFRRRSSVYRRKSRTVATPVPPGLLDGGTRAVQENFLAAVAAVLYRYLGTTDRTGVVVGVQAPGAADQLDPRPLLVEVDGGAPFSAVLDKAAAAIAESRALPGVPHDTLLASVGMAEVTDRNPLFPVVLRFEGGRLPGPDLRHDVTVTVGEGVLELEYNANACDEATVARFGAHVVGFLAAGLADPATAVLDVDYLPDEEVAELRRLGSGESVPREDVALHELFEAVAARQPDAEALVFADAVMSYGQLDERSNRLANHLRSLGSGVGRCVGLCVPASPKLIIGLLGVLKSGATVVPLVPTFPESRNRMAVEDAALDLVVTDSSLAHRFTDGPPAVDLDEHADVIAEASADALRSGVTAADPLYVLFTSGSTGRPKGVQLVHRTLTNLVRWQRERGLDPKGRRTLQRTSIGFDVSFQEVFSTLGFGGSLVIAPDDVRDDVSLLPDYVERYGITRLFLPPVALGQMAATAMLENRSLPTLAEVIVAGEQLQVSMPVRRLFHQIDCALDNQYGPTETHVVTAHALTGASTRWPEAPPIGLPVDNVVVELLDARLRPVPLGVPGELYVGGIDAAVGYLDPEAGQGRFTGVGEGRRYRTGDRARRLADGELEFLGRVDDQVKIRGYRIELGEVEANLLRIPGVRQAAVAVHRTDALGKQLTAYVVTDLEFDAADMRRRLLQDLPGHMVPATSNYVRMASLPLTATGKVNRAALPPPSRSAAAVSAAAEGDTEETVARIWAQALGLESVGRDADFIELGGHSLVGIQVVAQLNELYGISLPLRSLLRGTTVARLAADIENARAVVAQRATPAAVGSAEEASELRSVPLPGGRTVLSPQPEETRYLHLDVFGHRTYAQGGIRYPESGVVFDVGAHIGLFTLFALDEALGLRVFAFEPCPPLFEALRRNTEHLAGVHRFPFALGAARDVAELTYYPHLTGMSSFHADDTQDRRLLSGILHNLDALGDSRGGALLAGSKEYLAERLSSTTYTCERRTVSEVLAETGVERIALLKVDVQKAEEDVLRGISDQDWPRIDQVALELHDLDGRLARTTALLEGKGYRVAVAQDALHRGTAVHFVYAVRP